METFATSSPSPSQKRDTSRTLLPNSEQVFERLKQIYALTADGELLALLRSQRLEGITLDQINNRLMASFRDHGLTEAYSLLYEINYKQFMLIIFHKIKYYCHLLDPKDILQDVFLSIYRYPHKFREEKQHAFRNWTYSIIRNTILKHLKMRDSHEHSSDTLFDILEDKKEDRPLNLLVKSESLNRFNRWYILYLILYLNVVNNYLSERERLALHLVEVQDKRYREASKVLGIKLENFKMVVCRARKKILKRMHEMLGEDEP